MPTSRPPATTSATTAVMSGWSVTAAPTSPTRVVPSGIPAMIAARSTMRMPPFVERRITQYVQPREQPRAASVMNMLESTVCGVAITERAGRWRSSACATGGTVSPWMCGR